VRGSGVYGRRRAPEKFGRTVNLAARIAAYASADRVLVSERVVERAPSQG
jgi:class 3 adenylate cyclase